MNKLLQMGRGNWGEGEIGGKGKLGVGGRLGSTSMDFPKFVIAVHKIVSWKRKLVLDRNLVGSEQNLFLVTLPEYIYRLR
jgi:hypothetical protein